MQVPNPFLQYLPSALVRLGYLYPELVFSAEAAEVIIENCPRDRENTVTRDVLYTLYREKIYAETLLMRRSLFEAAIRP
jgi:hypothetical protein